MKLNYKIYGEGEPLFIMHGLYGSLDNWVGIARELQVFFKVILVDLRNHGRSPHSEQHSYDAMADDLLALMNELQIYKANIMGHSMGGKVAIAFSLYNPERVSRLLVVDISFRQYSVSEGDLQFDEHVNILNALFKIELKKMNSREDVDDLLAKQISSERIRAFLLKNLYRTKEKEFKWKLNLPVLLSNLENVLEGFDDRKDELSSLIQPVLFIKGGNSLYIQQKDIDLMPSFFANYKIVTIDDASHWVHAEKPNEFLAAVKDFCL